MFQLCLNLNRIDDSVGKALRTANQDRVTGANSHPLSYPRLIQTLKAGVYIMRVSVITVGILHRSIPSFEGL